MKLSQIFEQLTSGELRQLKIGGAEVGEIEESNYRAITNHVVLGLTALYTRFNLKENRAKVLIQPDRFTYPLQSKYAVFGPGLEPIRWVIDTADDKFGDDILKIERVIAVDTDVEFPLNDYNSAYSVFTPTMDTIRLPTLVVDPTDELDPQLKTTSVLVIYRANHPSIMPRLGFFDPQLTEVDLPMSHLQALLWFVASRVNNPIGMSNEFNAGNNYAAKYEMECKRLENAGLDIDTVVTTNRAQRNGWV